MNTHPLNYKTGKTIKTIGLTTETTTTSANVEGKTKPATSNLIAKLNTIARNSEE